MTAINGLLSRLLAAGAGNVFRSYIEAEQATMGLAALLRTLDPGNNLTAHLEKLYGATNDPESFSRTRFAQAVAALRIAHSNESNSASNSARN